MSDDIEVREFTVPHGAGHLVGNTIRQFAMRGTRTWQIGAISVGQREGAFGFSGGKPFSYLELLNARLVSNDINYSNFTQEGVYTFDLDPATGDYVHNGSRIVGIGNIQESHIKVYLVCASGTRTPDQNYENVRKLGAQAKDFITVPSKHTPAITFRYSVDSVEDDDISDDTVTIEATPGTIDMALESAIKLLSSLH